jgi:L-lactate dehydrogenase complex protein LldG
MSKAHILKAIQHNKPEPRPLPDIPGFESSGMDIVQAFGSTSAQNGTRVVNAADFSDLESAVRTLFPEKGKIASTLPDLTSEVNLQNSAPDALVDVDIAVIGGQVGVAENGAVWVTEADCVHRVLPFIAQHLVLVLPEDRIVRNMHEAYAQIKIDDTGFGVFIAGPSKTADIEQSLVIGAQGARSLTIILI